MFENLVNETASRFNLSTTSVSSLTGGVLSMMTNERTGGTEGFMDLFRRAGLGDIFTSWFGGKEGKTITPNNVETALGTGALDGLARASGLTRTVATSVLAFMLPKVVGRLTPSGVFPSRPALLSQVSNDIAMPTVRGVDHAVVSDRPGWLRWLPWVAAAVLALLAWNWMRGPAGTIDPQLTISNRDGRVVYSGVVRDDTERTAIVNALRSAYGESNIEGSLRVDPNVKKATWLPKLGDLFTTLKTPGVEFTLNGSAISLGGWLSPADRQGLNTKLRGVFGTDATISSMGDPSADAVRAANDKALTALGAIGTGVVTTDALVQALNMGVINFATGSADLPADSAELIRRSAQAMQNAPAGTRIEIQGHTDNIGDAASNMALSQARADSVRNALVSAGVPAAMLTTKGLGDTSPRTTNDTEYGRFQNRRIEYAVMTK